MWARKPRERFIWLKLNEIKDLLPDLEARSGWCHSQALEAIHNSSGRGEKVTYDHTCSHAMRLQQPTHLNLAAIPKRRFPTSLLFTYIWNQKSLFICRICCNEKNVEIQCPLGLVFQLFLPTWRPLSCKLSVTTVLHRLDTWSPDGVTRDHPWLTWKIYTPTCYIHFFEKCCLCKDTCHIHPHSSSQRFQRYMSSAMTSGLGRVLSSLCRETPKVKIAISWPGTQQWSEVRAVEAFKMRLIMMTPTNNRISIVAFINTETIPEIWNICILTYCIYIYRIHINSRSISTPTYLNPVDQSLPRNSERDGSRESCDDLMQKHTQKCWGNLEINIHDSMFINLWLHVLLEDDIYDVINMYKLQIGSNWYKLHTIHRFIVASMEFSLPLRFCQA